MLLTAHAVAGSPCRKLGELVVVTPELRAYRVGNLAHDFAEPIFENGPSSVQDADLTKPMEELVRIGHGATEEERIRYYALHELGLKHPVVMSPTTLGRSGAHVYLVKEGLESEPRFVIKLFPPEKRAGLARDRHFAMEIAALKLLHDLHLRHSRPVDIVDLGKLETSEGDLPAMVMSYAPEEDVETYLREVEMAADGAAKRRAFVALREAIGASAVALAELHHALPAAKPTDPVVRLDFAHDLKRAEIGLLEKDGILEKLAQRPGWITPGELAEARAKMKAIIARHRARGPFEIATAHDFRQSNISWDSKRKQIWLFDVQELAYSITRHDGKLYATNSAASDVGRALEVLHSYALDHGFTERQTQGLEDRFLSNYLQAAKQYRKTPLDEKEFMDDVAFYRLRFAEVLLVWNPQQKLDDPDLLEHQRFNLDVLLKRLGVRH